MSADQQGRLDLVATMQAETLRLVRVIEGRLDQGVAAGEAEQELGHAVLYAQDKRMDGVVDVLGDLGRMVRAIENRLDRGLAARDAEHELGQAVVHSQDRRLDGMQEVLADIKNMVGNIEKRLSGGTPKSLKCPLDHEGCDILLEGFRAAISRANDTNSFLCTNLTALDRLALLLEGGVGRLDTAEPIENLFKDRGRQARHSSNTDGDAKGDDMNAQLKEGLQQIQHATSMYEVYTNLGLDNLKRLAKAIEEYSEEFPHEKWQRERAAKEEE